MTPAQLGLADAYAAALERYAAAPTESALEAAYEIARHAMADGLGIIDLAAAHQRAVPRLLASLSPDVSATEAADRATHFLIEALSPFEMTLRGFREAIQRLEVAHDQLEERVWQRTAELSAANDHLQREVAERERAEQALGRSNAQLQHANREKDQFVTMISHELRNPLSAIVSGVEVLVSTMPADERSRRAIEIIRRNAGVQKRLLNDLLDLSRLTRDRLTLQRAPVALDTLARAVVSGEEEEARRAGVALSIDAEPGLWALGDADRVQQVLLNLLGNAIKFTPAGGRIDVTLFRCAGPLEALGAGVPLQRVTGQSPRPAAAGGTCVCIVVEDTGIGIDSALLPRLFNPFEQGDVASQRQRGLGLGLALVKLIAGKHGGKVWAESAGLNRGSTFVVALPALEMEQARGAAPVDGTIQVLLVEDNADTRELLAVGLESKGYRVLPAATGPEALAILATARPDLILSDLGLPGMSGYEFLERARQIDGMATVPAFAVTAGLFEQDVQRVRDAGFAGLFVKPVDVAALDQGIRAWLAASRRRKS